MKQQLQTLLSNTIQEIDSSWIESMMMGGFLVLLNLMLMLLVGLYWTNPAMHEYISGRPLL